MIPVHSIHNKPQSFKGLVHAVHSIHPLERRQRSEVRILPGAPYIAKPYILQGISLRYNSGEYTAIPNRGQSGGNFNKNPIFSMLFRGFKRTDFRSNPLSYDKKKAPQKGLSVSIPGLVINYRDRHPSFQQQPVVGQCIDERTNLT